jgi:hypothetical protein
MDGNRDRAGSGARGQGPADSRKERLAQALRANLKRRKQAGSGRAKGEKDKETSRRGDTHG